jgi:hypothetical protein
MLLTMLTTLPALLLLWAIGTPGVAGAEHHEIRITDSSVIDWLTDEDSCDVKEAEFQCLNHGDAYTVKAKMFKDCTGKHVYIQANAVKTADKAEPEPGEAMPGFVLTKRMASLDCPTPGECSLDTTAVCPLLDVAEVLNSDLVVIQRGD